MTTFLGYLCYALPVLLLFAYIVKTRGADFAISVFGPSAGIILLVYGCCTFGNYLLNL